jgi:hypothetical protein
MALGGFDREYVTRIMLNADQYKAEIKAVAKAIRDETKAEKDQKTVRKALGKQTETLEKQTAKLTKANTGLIRTWTDVAAAGRTALNIAKGVGRAWGAVAERGAQLSRLQDANTLSVKAATVATKGYLTQVDLLKAANAAVAFDLGFTEKQFAALSKAAVIMSRKLGTDANQAIGDLTLGMARQSRKILDNLGIMVSVTKANEEYAKALGKTEKQLTDAERKQAFMNATMAEIKRLTDGAALSIANAGDQWAVLKNKLTDAFDELSKSIVGTRAMRDLMSGLAEVTNTFASVISIATGNLKLYTDQGIAAVDMLRRLALATPGGIFKPLGKALAGVSDAAKQRREIQRELDRVGKLFDEAVAKEQRRTGVTKPAAAAAAGKTGKGRSKKAPKLPGLQDLGVREADPLGAYLDTVAGPNISIATDKLKEHVKTVDELIDAPMRAGSEGLSDFVIGKPEKWQEAEQAAQRFRDSMKATFWADQKGGILEQILPQQDLEMFVNRLAKIDASVVDFSNNIIGGFAGARDAMAGAMFDAIATEKSFGAALQQSFHTFLSTWGKKMMLQSLEYAALALGHLATFNYVGAAKAGAASAAFGVAAAAAGLGARALAPSKKTSTSRRGVDRGLGGTSSAARGSQAPNTFVYNINTLLPPREDEAAMIIAGLSRRAGNMLAA